MLHVNRIIVWENNETIFSVTDVVSPWKVRRGWTFEEDHDPPYNPNCLLDTFVTRFDSSSRRENPFTTRLTSPEYLRRFSRLHCKRLNVIENRK